MQSRTPTLLGLRNESHFFDERVPDTHFPGDITASRLYLNWLAAQVH
jgi:hypothetical protein